MRYRGAMLETVERECLRDVVATRIRDYILENKLGPGDRLPTEHTLADRYGVSRMSVREATRALGFLGILDAAPRRGLTVGKVDMRRITGYLGFHLALCRYSKSQLLDTRIIIETGVLPHVMQRMASDRAVYDRLEEMTQELRRRRALRERIGGDIAFHRALLELSGLEPLVAFNDLLQIFFDRFRRSVASGDWARGIEGHQRIIDALREGQLDVAVQELRTHIEYHKFHK